MWRLEVGLAMFWFIPLFLGFVIAFVLLRYSDRTLREQDGEAAKESGTSPEDPASGGT